MLVFSQSEAFDWVPVDGGGGLGEEGPLQLCLQVQIRNTLLSQSQQVHFHLQTIRKEKKQKNIEQILQQRFQ